MSSVSYYKRKDSPYFFLRIYRSKSEEPNPNKRRSSKTTKIPTTRAGEREIKQIVKQLNADLIKKQQQQYYGIDINEDIILSKGLDRFLEEKPTLALKTIEAYRLSTRHFIKACSDRNIRSYADSDYTEFIKFLIKKEFSQSSQSIFTRHLSAMWNYFIKQKWTERNIIIKVKSTKTNNLPIPYKDMQKLLNYYEVKNTQQYYLVYFLLLTGMRPSSAITVDWSNIKFDHGYIEVKNVKGKKNYYFPLHKELEEMLIKMGPQKKGILFPYQTQPKFFNKDCINLFDRAVIGHKYTVSQIRNTFPSWLLNKGVSLSTLQKLLDHTDPNITKKHYIEYEMKFLKKEIQKVRFREKKK